MCQKVSTFFHLSTANWKAAKKVAFSSLLLPGKKQKKRYPFWAYYAKAESKQKGVLSDEDFPKD